MTIQVGRLSERWNALIHHADQWSRKLDEMLPVSAKKTKGETEGLSRPHFPVSFDIVVVHRREEEEEKEEGGSFPLSHFASLSFSSLLSSHFPWLPAFRGLVALRETLWRKLRLRISDKRTGLR